MTLLIISIILIVAFYFTAMAMGDSGPSKSVVIALGIAFCTSIGLAYFFYKRCKKNDILGFKRFALVLLIPLFVPLSTVAIVFGDKYN
jgi:hypothetical protein